MVSGENKSKWSLWDIAIIGLFAALLFVGQVSLAFLPNIEIVSLLVILYSLHLSWRALPAVYIFVLLEGLVYGFHIWWVGYLYIWTILFFVARMLYKNGSLVGWAIVSAAFGLFYGAFMAIPYIFISGLKAAFAWFVAGVYFDITHCVGNFCVCIALFKPLDKLFKMLLGSRSKRI